MSTPSNFGSEESVPQVFDRIADTARRINEEGQSLSPQTFSKAEPVFIEQASPCQRVGVTIADGRIESLRVDSAAMQELGWRGVEPLLVATLNKALEAAQAAELEQIGEINKGFGELVKSLGGLQADLHAAYLGDMRRLG